MEEPEERVELPKLDQSGWWSWTPVKPGEALREELREFGQAEELKVAERLREQVDRNMGGLLLLLLPLLAILGVGLWSSHIGRAREAEEVRLRGDREVMVEEFTDWLSQATERQQDKEMDGEFRKLKEFHRCKAVEDVDSAAFLGLVENMARVLEISGDRKEEIQLARHSRSIVNVIEDFEYGVEGFYTYGKYQTFRRPNNNMDVVFALHTFKWEMADEEVSEEEHAGLARRLRKVNMRERTLWKNQFRAEAMRLFEADCPQRLVSEMHLKERRKEEKTQEDEEVRRKVARMYEEARGKLDKEKISQEQEGRGREEDGGGKRF